MFEIKEIFRNAPYKSSTKKDLEFKIMCNKIIGLNYINVTPGFYPEDEFNKAVQEVVAEHNAITFPCGNQYIRITWSNRDRIDTNYINDQIIYINNKFDQEYYGLGYPVVEIEFDHRYPEENKVLLKYLNNFFKVKELDDKFCFISILE